MMREQEVMKQGSDSQPHQQIFIEIPELQRTTWLLKESGLYLLTDPGPKLSVQALVFYRPLV